MSIIKNLLTRKNRLNFHFHFFQEYLKDKNNPLEIREQVANKLLEISLRARGYNNYENFSVSGENFFFENLFKRISPKNSLDVGANIGDYSKALLDASQGNVYAFEPLEDAYKNMVSLLGGYGERFIPVNKGVGDKNGCQEIYFSNDTTPFASFSPEIQVIPYLNNNQKKMVEIIKLDSYFEGINPNIQQIDFIKIDTEGFEFEVLMGAQKLINLHRPKAIQLEFNWHQLFRGHSINSFSKALPGYSVFQMHPEALIPRDPKDPYSNIFIFSNFLFVNNDYLSLI